MMSSLEHVRFHKRFGNGGLQVHVNGRNNTSITEVPLKEIEYHDLWTLQMKPLNTYIKIYTYIHEQ